MGKNENLIEYIKDRPGHDRRYSVDFSKTKQALDWQPTVSLEEGLRKTIAWYQNNQAWWRPLKKQNLNYFTKQYIER
jgi:dTDP-glucose 4,6-dehydratase